MRLKKTALIKSGSGEVMDNLNEYQFHILHTDEGSRWIFINDKEGVCGYDCEPFVFLLKRLAVLYDDMPVDLGEGRYRFIKDPYHFIFQWDDLFGIVFEYRCSIEKALRASEQLLETVNAYNKRDEH